MLHSNRKSKKKPLTGLDRVCSVQTMALSAEFLALKKTVEVEGSQMILTETCYHRLIDFFQYRPGFDIYYS